MTSATHSERQARRLLEQFDIPLVPTIYARDAESVALEAERLGFPVTLKADDSSLVHKSRAGGVVNDLRSVPDVMAACRSIEHSLQRIGRHSRGYALQPFERPGLDLLLSAKNDRTFGPCIIVGLGGSAVEEIGEVRSIPAEDLRSSGLSSVSNWPAAIHDALARTGVARQVEALGRELLDVLDTHPEISIIELNPVRIVSFPGKPRLTVLDALISEDASDVHKFPSGMPATAAPISPGISSISADAVRRALSAEHVAIVGVSRSSKGTGYRLLRNIEEGGFEGQITIVHPSGESIHGHATVTSMEELHEFDIDCIFVCLPAEKFARLLDSQYQAGSSLIVVISAGEIGQLPDSVPIIGPNTAGLFSSPSRLHGSFIGTMQMPIREDGNVAILTQSGSVGSYLLGRASEERVGIRYWIPTGNELHIHLEDILHQARDWSDVSVIGLFIEGIRDGETFISAARGVADSGKTIVAYAVGRTDAGRTAAKSHTSAVAGDYQIFADLAQRHGVLLTGSIEQLFDVLAILSMLEAQGHNPRRELARGLLILASSGASCTIAAEEMASAGLPLATMSSTCISRLRDALPSYAAVRNPMDLTADVVSRPSLFERVLEILSEELVAQPLYLALGTQAGDTARATAELVADFKKQNGWPVLVSRLGPESLSPEVVETYRNASIPVLPNPHRVVAACTVILSGNQGVHDDAI